MLATLCFLAIATVLDYFPSSIKAIDIRMLKYNWTSFLSFYAFYTLKCFCLYGEVWDNKANFLMNYDKCSFSKENEDDSTLISALNFTYYFLIDDRVNYALSIFLFVKIWYFSSPNEKWIDHSLYNLIMWHFNYHLKNQEWDFSLFARTLILFSAIETLRINFYPAKPDLYQGLSKLKLIFQFAIFFACHYAAAITLIACSMHYEQISSYLKDVGMYVYELISSCWENISGTIFEGIYSVFWHILTQIYYILLVRSIKFMLSISHKKGKNINEVIVIAALVFWGIFKIISLVLLYNGIILLFEHYYYVPSFFPFYRKILNITVFGRFLSYPNMLNEKKWLRFCLFDVTLFLLSVYFLEYLIFGL